MTLSDAQRALGIAIAELESSLERDLLSALTVSARHVLETTAPDDRYTEEECADDLRACAQALPVLAAGLVFARRRLQA